MKHASHKATTVSRQKFSLAKALFASGKGSHSVRAVRAVQSAGSDAVVLGLDPAIAEKINEIAPQTRRSIREAARAAERRSHILASASLAALVGTAAGALAFSNNEDATNSFVADPATTTTQIKRISDVTAASRSEARTDLSSSSVTAQSTNEGGWGLSNSDSTLDAKLMNRNNANNPVVSALVDADGDAVPAGFNPNMPLAPTPTTIRGVSARGTRTSVVPNWACLPAATSAMVARGRRQLPLWAIGWTTLLAMSVMLWCSLLARPMPMARTAMLPFWKRSMPTAPLRSPNPMPRDWV